MKVCFLIGSANISGGTYVIFQHALYLKEQGCDVTIAITDPDGFPTSVWHHAISELKLVDFAATKNFHFDIAIATWWKTVFNLYAVKAYSYMYFVQSIESRFYPQCEAPLRKLVDSTYGMSLPGITEATWIQQHLKRVYGITYELVRNGIRKDLYSSLGESISRLGKGKVRLLVEGPLGVDFKNVAKTVKLCHKTEASDIWLLTSTNINHFPRVGRVFSQVKIQKVPEIMRSCDLIVKLSYVEGMFGPPLEMFHCGGTALTYDVSGHDEYIVNDVNAVVVGAGNEMAAVNKINELCNNKEYLQGLKQEALATATNWPDWAKSSESFLCSLEEIRALPSIDRDFLKQISTQAFDAYIIDENKRLTAHPQIKFWPAIQSRLMKILPKKIVSLARYVKFGYIDAM